MPGKEQVTAQEGMSKGVVEIIHQGRTVNKNREWLLGQTSGPSNPWQFGAEPAVGRGCEHCVGQSESTECRQE